MDDSDVKYTPQPGEAQLTWRAVVVGSLTGSIIACTNVYIGLKIGWSFGASILAAVLSYSIFAVFNRHLSVLETNIAQAAGSSAGYMASSAGLLSAIPAMMLLGFEVPTSTIIPWGLGVSYLGLFFAVPLRRQFVEIEKLRFPTGYATAETILAMVSEAGDALDKSRALLWSGVIAAILTLLSHFFPQVKEPHLDEWLGLTALATAAAWGFKISLGPSLMGAGMLMGSRVVISLVAGAITGWGILGPLSQQQGWAPGEPMSYADGARGWILWPGVAILVCESLTALVLNWKTFFKAFTTRTTLGETKDADPETIPNKWWIAGIIFCTIWTMVSADYLLEIPWYLTLVAVPLSAILASVAIRSVGETDINPVGGMGKVTQLVFGGLAPGHMAINLMSAAITSGAASQAGDLMQDLKTGYLLKASPKKLFIAQLCGVAVGIIFVVPVFGILTSAWGLGSDKLPAPAGFAWKAMAEVLADGFSALPPYATTAMAIAGAFGAALPCLRLFPRLKPFIPSGLACGIAFIVNPYDSLAMFYGLVGLMIWRWLKPGSAEKLMFAVASGFIAGEGLMGIVNAILTLTGIGPK